MESNAESTKLFSESNKTFLFSRQLTICFIRFHSLSIIKQTIYSYLCVFRSKLFNFLLLLFSTLLLINSMLILSLSFNNLDFIIASDSKENIGHFFY